MRFTILMASPRPKGNTATLLEYFTTELQNLGTEISRFDLYNLQINPCIACRKCQFVPNEYGCAFDDDIKDIHEDILRSNCIVLASPIYAWYCTAPMKIALDRLIYTMNKYYGETKGNSLWRNKHTTIFTSCGYPFGKAVDLFEQGIQRYCHHSKLFYAGMFAARDPGYKTDFMTEEKAEAAKQFARELHARLKNNVMSNPLRVFAEDLR